MFRLFLGMYKTFFLVSSGSNLHGFCQCCHVYSHKLRFSLLVKIREGLEMPLENLNINEQYYQDRSETKLIQPRYIQPHVKYHSRLRQKI